MPTICLRAPPPPTPKKERQKNTVPVITCIRKNMFIFWGYLKEIVDAALKAKTTNSEMLGPQPFVVLSCNFRPLAFLGLFVFLKKAAKKQ